MHLNILSHLDHHMVPMAVLQHMAESTMPLAERPGRPARDGNTMGSFGPLFRIGYGFFERKQRL